MMMFSSILHSLPGHKEKHSPQYCPNYFSTDDHHSPRPLLVHLAPAFPDPSVAVG